MYTDRPKHGDICQVGTIHTQKGPLPSNNTHTLHSEPSSELHSPLEGDRDLGTGEVQDKL